MRVGERGDGTKAYHKLLRDARGTHEWCSLPAEHGNIALCGAKNIDQK